ncbi:MAG: hypothetical protein IJ761_08235 [Bacteroidales bacterium]|nr:hypothetical protein [Bacteroidales bacterium]MBR1799862.1 hypothetical protein [Bacteroidales bacterium]
MPGKIFPESANIYQDKAKVLFNYYSQMAEKIVAEEERIEGEISKLESLRKEKEQSLSKLLIPLIIPFAILIVPIFIYLVKKKNLTKEIAEIDVRLDEFRKQHKEIFRDYKVNKLGVAYVPVAEQIKYEDKSFIVDYTNSVKESKVTLQMSNQNDLLVQTINEIDNLSADAPVTESSNEIETVETDDYSTSIQQINQHDYFGKLERSLRTIGFCLDDLDVSSVSLPLVGEESEYLGFLREYATDEVPEGAPVVKVFDKERFEKSINKFQELNRLKDSLSNKTAQFEDVLKNLMVTMAHSVQTISALKVASADKVIFESNKLLYQILKAPYNHYSPLLEHDEIERIRQEKFDFTEDVQGYVPFQLKESSRVKYNLITGMWTAEDGTTTTVPFGVHQIYEEIVAPVVQNLMRETRIERLKIYNHIKDQKISYLNKWNQDTDAFYRDNRSESNKIISAMQESLREYTAAYNTLVSLQRTEANMAKSGGELDSTLVESSDNVAETAMAFETQSQQFKQIQSQFEEYMDRLQEDIREKGEKFGHVEYYDAKLRDGHSNEEAVAAGEVNQLDSRRKPLAAANPLLAKTAEMLPTPNIDEITYEYLELDLPSLANDALNSLGEKVEVLQPEEETSEELNAEVDNTSEVSVENEAVQANDDEAADDTESEQ